jgi:ribosomal protein L12E/L44/L45/RPP1/RPP2
MLQSSIRPDLYAQRMLDFILKHTDYDEVMAQRAAAAKAAADAGAAVNAERKKLL